MPATAYTMPELLLFIGAIASAVVAIITAWRTGGKIDGVSADVEKVHTLTNDRATKQDALNLELQGQIKVLIATIAAQDQKEAIANDRVTQAANPPSSPPPAPDILNSNVSQVKKDVAIVKADVKEVKADIKQLDK